MKSAELQLLTKKANLQKQKSYDFNFSVVSLIVFGTLRNRGFNEGLLISIFCMEFFAISLFLFLLIFVQTNGKHTSNILTAYLHVGPHKTGSSHLQMYLIRGKRIGFEKAGFCFFLSHLNLWQVIRDFTIFLLIFSKINLQPLQS